MRATVAERRLRCCVVQELQGQLSEGREKCDKAVEAGERLYKDTATEGRETIRKELRVLREQLDAYSDLLADALKQHEQHGALWATFQASLDQTTSWLKDTEVKVARSGEICATLTDKRSALQAHKVTFGLLTLGSFVFT